MLNSNPRLDQLLQNALQHHKSARLPQAEALYREILAENPGHARALQLLGVIAHQVGRHDIAVDLIRQAIAIQGDFPEAYGNLANALRGLGRIDEAIAAFRHAILLRPDYFEVFINLGNALLASGQVDEAISVYRHGMTLRPESPEAHTNLGNAFKQKGQLDEAIAAHRQAIALRPDYPDAHINLGVALRDQGRTDEAIAAYRQALVLKRDYAEAYSNLGNALRDKGQPDEALAAFRQAVALKPNHAEVHSNLGSAMKDKGQLDEAVAVYRHALALKPSLNETHSNLVFDIHFLPEYNARDIALELSRWNQQHAQPLAKFIQPHSNDPNPERRLRIGYVSPDFREHSVGRFILPLLAHHDRGRFEVFAYSQVVSPDQITHHLRGFTDGWRSIVQLHDAQAADLIRQDKIDILVDLTMHTANNRLLIFARKPAPVQVTYLAYCSSTGLQTIDYRLSDPYLDPPGTDESIYSERTIRLPETYWCYPPAISTPEIGPLPAQQTTPQGTGSITFGCLNTFCKVSEPALTAWAKLLLANRGSQLLLYAHEGNHRQRLLARLQHDGIDPRRIRFVGKQSLPDYLQTYNQIDIALDTFPYAGGTTTCDALWMGVPVVSLLGNTAVGRGGFSILSNIRLPELVARSTEQYVQIAAELANDLPRLADLRSTLRRRMQLSPLMDAPRYARAIESAYRQMWRQWCAKGKPQ